MTISELREKTGMNRKSFCEYFDIPYRTVSDWESGERKCSDYIVRALYYEWLVKSTQAKIIRYEIKLNRMEVPYEDRDKIESGMTIGAFPDTQIIDSFQELSDALENLKDKKSSITLLTNSGSKYFLVEEYCIEENKYDVDGEWLGGGDIHAYSSMHIELIEKPEYKTIATFDSVRAAEEALNEYSGDKEVFIKY